MMNNECRRLVTIVEPNDSAVTVNCGDTIAAGDDISYSYPSAAGGYIRLYNADSEQMCTYGSAPANGAGLSGGALTVPDECASIVVGPNIKLSKAVDTTVSDIVNEAQTIEELYGILDECSFDYHTNTQDIVNMWLSNNTGAGGPVDAYTKAEADVLLAGKAPIEHTHPLPEHTHPLPEHTHTASDVGAAPAGFGGFGERLPAYEVTTNDDTDGTKFNEVLENLFASMEDRTSKQIVFSDYPYLSGSLSIGTVWRHNANYGTLFGESYDGQIVFKRRTADGWQDFVRVAHTGNISNYAALAGFGGFGEFMVTNNPTNADEFHTLLDSMLDNMSTYSSRRFCVAIPGSVAGEWVDYAVATLYKQGANKNSAVCTFIEYGRGRELICHRTSSGWGAVEWVNPWMNLGVEYRTTERITGKAVYKKNDNGVIQYRLDGETAWTPVTKVSVSSIVANAAGWYRVLKCAGTGEAKYMLNVHHQYYTAGSASVTAFVCPAFYNPGITVLSADFYTVCTISKIRLVKTATDYCVDVYYSPSTRNTLRFKAIPVGADTAYTMLAETVADVVDGETVLRSVDVIPSTSGNLATKEYLSECISNTVPIRQTSQNGLHAYNSPACYVNSDISGYYRITLPDNTLNRWAMIHIELSIADGYGTGQHGKVFIYVMHDTTGTWSDLKGVRVGNVPNINVYVYSAKYIYVGVCGKWSSASIDKILCSDAIVYQDISGTTLDIVSELPSGYRSAAMTNG